MTGQEIIHEVEIIVTGLASVFAGIKSWRAASKSDGIKKDVGEIKAMLVQQQAQKQSQNITVNVGSASTVGSPLTESSVILSTEEQQ